MATSDDDELDDILDSALDSFQVPSAEVARPCEGAEGTSSERKADKAGSAASGSAKHSNETAAEEALQAFEDALKPLNSGVGENDEEADMEMVAEFVKSFEKLGLAGNAGTSANPQSGAASEIENAIKSLISDVLSKDVLEEPMHQIRDSLSKWLEENEATLDATQRTRHKQQYDLVSEICAEYETDADSGRIVELLAKLKDSGKLPADVMSELPDDVDDGEGANLENLPAELQQLATNCPVQ